MFCGFGWRGMKASCVALKQPRNNHVKPWTKWTDVTDIGLVETFPILKVSFLTLGEPLYVLETLDSLIDSLTLLDPAPLPRPIRVNNFQVFLEYVHPAFFTTE